ncbi:Cyclin-G2 [Cricetulus griseus]|uniref:Cyclin-G2 n=1 Tax=Cricetulus griseus TaxID=10029 RepID=G3ICA3_CRIGR|nr:Cyclin-G2 [Cricetulus griseus]ERE91504.1 cyclin-G2-like protein [Cricetulus griseus]
MKDLGAEHLAGGEGVQLLGLLNFYLEQEQRFQPREKGLSLMEDTPEVKPKHLSCIGVCCFLLAARMVEEECNVPPTHDVIRISQCKCTASDIERMEKIISEKLHYELEATTALNFLHLYHAIVFCHTSERKEILSLDKLEAQLKACSCRLVFSKAKISDTEFFYWRELVSKCLAEYSSPECCKPDLKKLVWIVSRRTAQNLHNSYYSVPELPTIPEGGCFDGSESEDSCEDMSCGEDSLSSSPPSDQECTFFFDFKVAQTLCFPS